MHPSMIKKKKNIFCKSRSTWYRIPSPHYIRLQLALVSLEKTQAGSADLKLVPNVILRKILRRSGQLVVVEREGGGAEEPSYKKGRAKTE